MIVRQNGGSRAPAGGWSRVDLSSRTAQLCIAGTQAEVERRLADARTLFDHAWHASTDDYEASMAAHYVAHLEPDPTAALEWELEALRRARLDPRTDEFLPSLYVSLGGTYERVGDTQRAREFFDLAAALGVVHQPE